MCSRVLFHKDSRYIKNLTQSKFPGERDRQILIDTETDRQRQTDRQTDTETEKQ